MDYYPVPETPAPITPECLLSMRDLIVKHGWVRHEYGNCDRGFCLLGAYSRACLNWDIEERGHEPEMLGGGWSRPLENALEISDVTLFNDWELKDQAEAIALLETTAAKLKGTPSNA